MLDSLSFKSGSKRETAYFLDWLEGLFSAGYLAQAREVLQQAENKVSALKAYRTTPQSAPWHVEGPVVADHVERALAGLEAILDGASILEIEELARYKELREEIVELQETIRENAATMRAFVLLHDIAKTVTINFDAPPGSKGEKEGFQQHKYRSQTQASKAEMNLYQKLYKAFTVAHSDLDQIQLMAKFYDQYEIKTHYPDHAKVGAGHDFFNTREAICDQYRLTTHDRALLTFMIRNHIDVLNGFERQADPAKFNLLIARANKAGFDADDALDLMVAGLFLDSVIGCVAYKDGKIEADLKPLINILRAEEQLAPQRRVARRDKSRLRERRIMKDALAQANLAPEEVFALLGTPVGPERGLIMKQIYDLVIGSKTELNFGDHNSTLAPRIRQAQQIFDQLSST